MARPKPASPDPDQNPTHGGSYTRCPDTGALTRVEGPPLDDAADAADAAAAPATPPVPAVAEFPIASATSQE